MKTCQVCNLPKCPVTIHYGKEYSICDKVIRHYGYWNGKQWEVTEGGKKYFIKLTKKICKS